MPSSAGIFNHSLGFYLKERRLLLKPKDVGLPVVEGRRIDGLRQDEVAVLSGVSSRWLRDLENDVLELKQYDGLERVLTTLQFNATEQKNLLQLAGWKPEPQHVLPKQVVSEHLQKVVDQMKYPAFVVNAFWQRICWNKSAEQLFSHWLGKHAYYENLMDYLLFDPQSRQFVLNWEADIPLWIDAFYQSVMSQSNNKKVWLTVEERLAKSQTLADHWPSGIGKAELGLPAKDYWFLHPSKGVKSYMPISMKVQNQDNWHLVVWLP